jgi:ribose/xylose/arabinose/galactoside ABC-type transport system permease subunit
VVAPVANLSASKSWFRQILLSDYFVLYLTIAYVLMLWPIIPPVMSTRNINNVLSNMWPLLVIASGQTFVLLVAGIDLSQTANMALTSVIGAVIMTNRVNPVLFEKSPLWGVWLNEDGSRLADSAWAMPVAVIVMLVIGLLIGLLNGVCVARLRMPPFMVTLIAMMFYSALAIYLPKSENIMGMPAAFVNLGRGKIFDLFGVEVLTVPMLISLTLVALAIIFLSRTIFGRWIYATGFNPKASEISGIPTTKVIIMAYMLSGMFAAVGAALYSARMRMGRPTLGSSILLDIVGANVIGGVSLAGGKGSVRGTLLGVLFFVLLSNTLGLLNLSFHTIDIVKGLVILGACLLDVIRTRIRAREMAS